MPERNIKISGSSSGERRKTAKKRRAPRTKTHGKMIVVHVGEGVESLNELRAELDEMKDVLFGRLDPPINNGVLTLQEVSTAYYARAKEIESMLHRYEADGVVPKGSKHYKFRTGELRSFIDLAKGAMELGSRRLTNAQVEAEQRLG